jgi:hypothetical protein
MGGGGIAQRSDPRKGGSLRLAAICGTKNGRPGRLTRTPNKQPRSAVCLEPLRSGRIIGVAAAPAPDREVLT